MKKTGRPKIWISAEFVSQENDRKEGNILACLIDKAMYQWHNPSTFIGVLRHSRCKRGLEQKVVPDEPVVEAPGFLAPFCVCCRKSTFVESMIRFEMGLMGLFRFGYSFFAEQVDL